MTDFDDPRRFGKFGERMTAQPAPSAVADRFPLVPTADVPSILERSKRRQAARTQLLAATARQAARDAKGSRRLPHQTPSTYVIGIEGSPLVKIGYTGGTPEARVGQLQTGLPMQLQLLWSSFGDYEAELHARFAAHRVRGEWFDLTPLGDPVEVVTAAVVEINAAFRV